MEADAIEGCARVHAPGEGIPGVGVRPIGYDHGEGP
jgi:hypothetical protein